MEFTNWRQHPSNPAKRIDLAKIEVRSNNYDLGTLGIELHAEDGRIATIQIDEADLAELRRTLRRAYVSKAAEAKDETAEDYAGRLLDLTETLIWRLELLMDWPSEWAIKREIDRLTAQARADMQIAKLEPMPAADEPSPAPDAGTDGPGEAE